MEERKTLIRIQKKDEKQRKTIQRGETKANK